MTLFTGDSAGEGGRNAVSQAGSSFAEGRAEDGSNGGFILIPNEHFVATTEFLIFHKDCPRLSLKNN